MIVSAHQPAYNPWLGYIHKILISDTFVVMDDVQFEKNSFINRNKILQNSKEIMLTIPVKTNNYKEKRIRDIEIADEKWKKKHLRSIEVSYKKSKMFDVVFKQIEFIYKIKSKYLIDYTNAFLEFIIDYLQIDNNIVFASNFKISSKKLDYICELTHKIGGRVFVFGALGKNYVDENYLKEKGIIPYFQDYKHPVYNQLSNEFHPYMGILDLLFNEERKKIKDIILQDNIKKDELKRLLNV